MSMIPWFFIQKMFQPEPKPLPPPPPVDNSAADALKATADALNDKVNAAEPDKDVSATNAGKAEEKRRLLSTLPKATKTRFEETGETGTVQKKRLLGQGDQGKTTLG